MRSARFVLFPLVLGAAACGTTPEETSGSSTQQVTGDTGLLRPDPRTADSSGTTARRATFNCDGTALTVVIAKETVDIIWNAGTDTLAERPAESGVLYESLRNVLRGEGNELTWTLDGRTPRHCVAMR